jgi:hypothetical protein
MVQYWGVSPAAAIDGRGQGSEAVGGESKGGESEGGEGEAESSS